MGKVEEVAAAIRLVNETTEGLSFTMLSFEMARAAIEAMKEPTTAMVEAGVLDTKSDVSIFDVSETYNAMIDAALSEDKEQG